MNNSKRKIIQIATTADGENPGNYVYALCNDGTFWIILWKSPGEAKWIQMPEIPQPTAGKQS